MGDTRHAVSSAASVAGAPRILHGGSWPGLSLVAACLVLAGCDPLEAIEEDGCGNRVINTDEDCDGPSSDYPEAACAGPDEANACFFVCQEMGQICPDGWGCGADGRCRQPGGHFEGRNGPSLAHENFAVDDVDGDGALDLVGSVGSSVSVRFGDGGGQFDEGFDQALPLPTGAISFGHFNNDERLDMIAPVELGFFSLFGTADRALEPFNYAPFSVPGMPTDSRLVTIEGYIPAETSELNPTELVLFVDTEMIVLAFDDQGGMIGEVPNSMSASQLARELPRHDLDGDSLTELVLLYQGHDRAYFYKSSGSKPLRLVTAPVTDAPVQQDQLLLPVGYELGELGGMFADVDVDGDVDLLLAVRRTVDGTPGVAVAYQGPAGTLDARASIEPLFCDRGTAGGGCVDQPWPLAAADFNRDDLMDYVFSDGIGLAKDDPDNPDGIADSILMLNGPTGDAEWDQAVILDINGDDQPDVAAASGAATGVDIFLNTYPSPQIVFNPFPVDTSLPIESLRVGDYDGDLVADLAFVEQGGARAPDRLSVIFGAALGGPTGRVDMGAVGDLQSLDTGSLLFGLNGPDMTSDLLFLARPFFPDNQPPGPVAVAVMFGDASRKLLSPFLLSRIPFHYPVATVLGQFGHPAMPPEEDSTDALVVMAGALQDQRAYVALAAGIGGQGDAHWQPNYVAKMPLDQDFNSSCALFTAGPLRDSGADALIGVDFGPDCAGGGAFNPRLLLGEDVAQTLWPGGPPPIFQTEADYLMFLASAPELPVTVEPLVFTATAVRRLELRDMNSDGKPDLLLVLSGSDQIGHILILWNSDICGGARLCAAARTELSIADVATLNFDTILDAAAIRLDRDPPSELAVLTDQGVFALRLDKDTLEYGAPAWLSREDLEFRSASTGRLRVADVDADGLEDLVVNTDDRVRIGLQQTAELLGAHSANKSSDQAVLP